MSRPSQWATYRPLHRAAMPTEATALRPEQHQLLTALVLMGAARPRNWLQECLDHAVARDDTGKRFTQDHLRTLMRELADTGWIVEASNRLGYWRVAPEHVASVYEAVLARSSPADLARWSEALLRAEAPYAGPQTAYSRMPSAEAALSQLRLLAFQGATPQLLGTWRTRMPWNVEFDEVLTAALCDELDDALFARLHPGLRTRVLEQGLMALHANWHAALSIDAPAAAHALLQADTSGETFALRVLYAEHLLLSGQPQQVAGMLIGLQDDEADDAAPWPLAGAAMMASVRAAQADWAPAEAAFDATLAKLRKVTGKRRGLVPLTAGTLYVQSLLAQGTPAHLQKALKFCLGEGGKREPVLDSPYGLMALAIQMRTGEARRDLGWFKPYSRGGHVSPLDWWRWLMRAWLKEGSQPEPLPADQADAAQRLQDRLTRAGLLGLRQQLDAAMQVLAGEAAPAGFFIAAPQEGWQLKLEALRALSQPEPPASPAASKAPGETRLLWTLAVDDHGQVLDLQPFEQARGPRGWNKPKEVTLTKLQRGAEALPAHDAPVARTIRQESSSRKLRFELPAAVAALVRHPCLSFNDAPDTLVQLDEASPELDVVSEGERLRVRMFPGLHAARTDRWVASAAEQREQEALRAITVLRDGPQRARLVRLTPAQQRVAQLLGVQGLEIPKQGAAELQEVLQGLGTHFQIHADDVPAANPAKDVPAESRLRAELTPVGTGLQLRLIVAPFGEAHRVEGPRLVPGSGRARVMAHLGGQTLSVQRDLAQERDHLERVLDACPMLTEPAPDAPCEWTLDAPDDALTLVERLRHLNAVAALDWPQGKPVRVDTAGLNALTLRVHTKQEWLAVQGNVQVDEQLVLSLKQLIAFAGGSKSRFVPMGEGRYLALTQELRTRLDDLAAVADQHKDELRIPTLAAAWVDDTLQGAQVETDAAFTQRVYHLARARDLSPALPATLQASLRPYQEEGYVWAMRLAEAGLGACLADDMGLGKTLQALAVLLARAAGGPALVVAPTSLVGNWQAEARRFAPSLNVHVYAEGERDAVLAQAGAQDVVVVSYQLLQMAATEFAQKLWHTLVIDEAQAIKNAAAKRSQAVFDLQAGFRLALSGTPIENRLAELWSIMRAVNPGLLGSQARFNERFAGLIERQKDRQAQRQLRRLISPFILRRTKAQVLDDLPPRTELVLHVEAEAHERAHYEALRLDALEAAQKALSGNAAGQAHLNVLAQLTRLRRAACDPRLVSPGLNWVGAKVQAFAELATELVANGHKALVFSQFVDFLGLLREPLDAAGIAYQYLDGSTPAAERTKRVNAFQAGEGDLFLISLKAGGFGLNLTVADYVVIADPWWNPAAEDQATGRAHRIGQQRPVTVYRLVNQGTLEEGILTLHKDKRELADSVLEGDEGAMGGAVPAPEELLRLMRGEADPT